MLDVLLYHPLHCKSLTESGARLAGSQHPPISFLHSNSITGAHSTPILSIYFLYIGKML